MLTDPHPQRLIAYRGGKAEFRRLAEAGVNQMSAAILARLIRPVDDENAYNRQCYHGWPTTPATRAAHARGQARRRAERKAG